MRNKGLIYEYDSMIYPVIVSVCIGCSNEELSEHYEGDFDDMPTETLATVSWASRRSDDRCVVVVRVRNRRDLTMNTIVHECGHVALEIYAYVHARINYDDQEPFCYLLGWIGEVVNKARVESGKKKNKKIENK